MSEPSLDVYNPSNGELIETVTADTRQSAQDKLNRLQRRFQSGKRKDLPERINVLKQLSVYLLANKSTFLDTMVREGGKPWKDSEIEFNRALQGIELAIQAISVQVGAVVPLGYQASSVGRSATTRFFPRGVVLAFSAFNHPLNLIIHQVIPAFACGCPCLIKPAPDTPLTCHLLVEAMHSVGVPEDDLQLVITADNTLAAELVRSERIAYFSFIGSAEVGWMLRSLVQPGVRCALEHGGIAPCIVTQNAEIEKAVAAITTGGFYHAGQVCVSTQRVFVESSVFDTFLASFSDSVRRLRVGDAMSAETDVGPIIRKQALDRIHRWVNEAIDDGAQCLLGATPVNEFFYSPTVLVNPSESAKVSQEEVFGPVVCVYRYQNFESALACANHTKFAFQTAIFTQNVDEIFRAYEVIDASAVIVNDHTAFRDDVMPFAGLKQSGLGIGGIPYTIRDMQYEKMLIIRS